MFLGCYNNKTVLVTGHTGFKGVWLSLWLKRLGASIVGISNNIPSVPSHYESGVLSRYLKNYEIDVRDAESLNRVVSAVAQSLVRPSYENPLETLATNAMGSANILDALRMLDKPVVAVMITSDKAYDNVEWVWGYRETDRLGGKDPYSASKGMAELAIRTYVDSYFNSPGCNVRVGITRAGNVIGGGDWAKDRIVADCMRAWSENKMVDIRSPKATRPWQHVLEPLSGYLALGAELYQSSSKHGEAYNFGPPVHQNHPVSELIDEMGKYWDHVRWNDISQSQEHLHEAGLLKLNCDKALFDLQWQPTLQFEETVRMTVEWYKAYYQNPEASMYDFTIGQIDEYTELARHRRMSWVAEI